MAALGPLLLLRQSRSTTWGPLWPARSDSDGDEWDDGGRPWSPVDRSTSVSFRTIMVQYTDRATWCGQRATHLSGLRQVMLMHAHAYDLDRSSLAAYIRALP